MTQPTERVEAAAKVLRDRTPFNAKFTGSLAELMLDAADEADGITFRVLRQEYVEVEGWVWCERIDAPDLIAGVEMCRGPHRPLFTERHVHSFKCEECGEVES